MREHEVAPPRGARRDRTRVGRGLGSGLGTYAGKGVKGQKARAGVRMRPGFEGGQLPMVKRLPEQRGFRNPFRIEYQVVNVASLDRFDAGAEVTPADMLKAGLLRDLKRPVKVLGEGELTKAVKVRANKFSTTAREKIAAAGGAAEEIVASAATGG